MEVRYATESVRGSGEPARRRREYVLNHFLGRPASRFLEAPGGHEGQADAVERRKTKKDLWAFIGRHFRLWLPYKRFTPGHSSPFDFVWDAWCSPGQKLAAWANRSGLKTLCASIIAALEYYAGRRIIRSRVLSGSEDQARNLYGYWQRWCWTVLKDRVAGEPGRQWTRLVNGDFEILAASQKRVRGAKVQRLYRDEEDEIAPEISAASVGMLAGRGGVPARTIVTSTWHRPGGPMGRLVADAGAKGFRLHK